MGDVRSAAILTALAVAGCELIVPTPPDPPDASAGGSGGTTSASTSTSAPPVECLTPVDCPGSDADCVTRTCVSGACGFANLPLGTPTENQVAGDCQRAVCDGEGQEVLIIDEDDVPIDADPCTDDVCTASIPSNPPSGAGKPCNTAMGRVCDGAGACVECVAAADCPPGLSCVNNACE